MDKYDYMEHMKQDILDWLAENVDYIEGFDDWGDLHEGLRDTLWINDSVTGNASGSYTMNTWEAEECICHNWDLLDDALEDFGYSYDGAWEILSKGAEWCDVTIRCYLLDRAIDSVFGELSYKYPELSPVTTIKLYIKDKSRDAE